MYDKASQACFSFPTTKLESKMAYDELFDYSFLQASDNLSVALIKENSYKKEPF